MGVIPPKFPAAIARNPEENGTLANQTDTAQNAPDNYTAPTRIPGSDRPDVSIFALGSGARRRLIEMETEGVDLDLPEGLVAEPFVMGVETGFAILTPCSGDIARQAVTGSVLLGLTLLATLLNTRRWFR